MSDMKRLLEAVDKIQFAGEPEGQKPGDQWLSVDKNPPGKKLVGEKTVFKELENHVKENAVERRLRSQLAEFKQVKQSVAEGYTVTRGIDRDRYQERPGLEGPFSTRSGKVVYYDPKEGKYYDPDTDFYIDHDDYAKMDEGVPAVPGKSDSPVASAIIRRILMQRTDLLAQHGPDRVMQAVDDVADLVGDMDDIGSSDISGWVNMVQEILDSLDQGVAEGSFETEPVKLNPGDGVTYQGTPAEVLTVAGNMVTLRHNNVVKAVPANTVNETDFSEGIFGLSAKEKGAIQNITSKLSDIPGMWDFQKSTFTPTGLEKLKSTLKNNPSYIKYAVNLTADDFHADLNEVDKIGDKYDPEEFDQMVSRLGKKAKQGPMKTVWDPQKRVYKNVPVNQSKQPVKEYGNAQDPDNQKTTPGAEGSAEQDKEDDIGAKLGAQATNQSINALKAIEPSLNPTLAKQALAKGEQPTTMSSAETGQAKELSDLLGTALSNPQTSSQVTALIRKAAQLKGK